MAILAVSTIVTPPPRPRVDVGAYTFRFQRPDGSMFLLDEGDDFIVLKGAQGLDDPSVTISSRQPSGWDGDVVEAISAEPREVFLPLELRSDTLMGLRAMKASLLSFLNPFRGPVTLRVGLPDGTGRLIDGYYKGPLSGGMDPESWWVRGQKVGVTIRCGQPFWRDETDWSVVWGLPTSRTNLLPILPLAPAASAVLGNVNPVTIPGDRETYAVWTLTGPMNSCTIRDVGAGRSFTFTRPIAAGDSYVIDTRRGRQGVLAPDGSRQRSALNPGAVLFPLKPGLSRIQAVAEGALGGTAVTGVAPTRWLAA